MAPHRSLLKLLLPLLVLLLALPVAAASTEDGDLSLADLDLEELMEIELNALNVTGIHHTHDKGEFMVGYSNMSMNMAGIREGTSRMSSSEVLNDFMVTPTEMDMRMHMVDFMYAPSDTWTLMVMVPYRSLSMTHVTRMGASFETRSEGVGDISLSGLYSVFRRDGKRVVFNAGLSVPTGSIDERGDTPMGYVRLPYPMQLGSGTYDLCPGVTYLDQGSSWAWGAHAGADVRLGENSNDYRLGNRFGLSVWAARKFAAWFSSSIRLDGAAWGNVHGADPLLNPAMVPTADPDLRAGERLDVIVGANFFALQGALEGHRIAVEAGVPVYQSLTGPQLETDLRFSLSWIWTFER